MPQIAPTTFSSGVDRSLQVQDVYGGAEATNLAASIAGLPGDLSDNLKSTFAPGGGLSDVLNDLSKAITPGVKTFKEALGQVKSAVNDPGGLIDRISGDLLGDMLSSVGYAGDSRELINGVLGVPGSASIEDLLTKNISSVRIVSDALTVVRKIKDVDSFSDVMNLVSQITGNDDLKNLFNIGPELSVLKSVMNKLMDYRIPELYDLMVNEIKNEKDRKLLYLHASINAARKSDLDFLNKAIDLVGAGSIMTLYPDIVLELFRRYRREENTDFVSTDQIDRLVNVANRLDPRWNVAQFNKEDIHDLSCFTIASPDAQAGFSIHPEYQVSYLVAKGTREEDLKANLKKKYPNAAWAFETT